MSFSDWTVIITAIPWPFSTIIRWTFHFVQNFSLLSHINLFVGWLVVCRISATFGWRISLDSEETPLTLAMDQGQRAVFGNFLSHFLWHCVFAIIILFPGNNSIWWNKSSLFGLHITGRWPPTMKSSSALRFLPFKRQFFLLVLAHGWNDGFLQTN